jgi:excisionase family DNA binding protein
VSDGIERAGQSRRAAIATGPIRGLNRMEAAAYIGISASKFSELVADGRMPHPKCIDGRRIWDVRELDQHFDDLPGQPIANPWDENR